MQGSSALQGALAGTSKLPAAPAKKRVAKNERTGIPEAKVGAFLSCSCCPSPPVLLHVLIAPAPFYAGGACARVTSNQLGH